MCVCHRLRVNSCLSVCLSCLSVSVLCVRECSCDSGCLCVSVCKALYLCVCHLCWCDSLCVCVSTYSKADTYRDTLIFHWFCTSVWKICSTKHLDAWWFFSPSRGQFIHTKLDCKINFAFMYAVYYQGYSKRKALSQMRLCVFESLSLYVGVYVRLYMFEIVP